MTCWRRLRDWQAAGVWEELHQELLAEMNAANEIDWSRAVVDSASLRALQGGPKTGPNPTDRAKPGSNHHMYFPIISTTPHALCSIKAHGAEVGGIKFVFAD